METQQIDYIDLDLRIASAKKNWARASDNRSRSIYKCLLSVNIVNVLFRSRFDGFKLFDSLHLHLDLIFERTALCLILFVLCLHWIPLSSYPFGNFVDRSLYEQCLSQYNLHAHENNNHSVRIDLKELDSTSNVRKIYVTRLFCMLPNVLKHAILYFQSKTFNYKDTGR